MSEKLIKHRNSLVKQRIEERLQSAKKLQKLDLEKCPLLSKPGETYVKTLKKNVSVPSLGLFNEFVQTETSPSSTNLKQKDFLKLETIVESAKAASCLRQIYPSTRNTTQFFVLEETANIFISFTLSNGLKLMIHSEFRSFIR